MLNDIESYSIKRNTSTFSKIFHKRIYNSMKNYIQKDCIDTFKNISIEALV